MDKPVEVVTIAKADLELLRWSLAPFSRVLEAFAEVEARGREPEAVASQLALDLAQARADLEATTQRNRFMIDELIGQNNRLQAALAEIQEVDGTSGAAMLAAEVLRAAALATQLEDQRRAHARTQARLGELETRFHEERRRAHDQLTSLADQLGAREDDLRAMQAANDRLSEELRTVRADLTAFQDEQGGPGSR